jgi:hypothetical protein
MSSRSSSNGAPSRSLFPAYPPSRGARSPGGAPPFRIVNAMYRERSENGWLSRCREAWTDRAHEHDVDMTAVDEPQFVPVGPRPYLERFLAEYGLVAADLEGKLRSRIARGPYRLGPDVFADEYLVHVSLLRSHGEFPCAGDVAALRFCRAIAAHMVRRFGISRRKAVGRVNRAWSEPDARGVVPRVWVVGLDTAYHDTPPRSGHQRFTSVANHGGGTLKPGLNRSRHHSDGVGSDGSRLPIGEGCVFDQDQ